MKDCPKPGHTQTSETQKDKWSKISYYLFPFIYKQIDNEELYPGQEHERDLYKSYYIFSYLKHALIQGWKCMNLFVSPTLFNIRKKKIKTSLPLMGEKSSPHLSCKETEALWRYAPPACKCSLCLHQPAPSTEPGPQKYSMFDERCMPA